MKQVKSVTHFMDGKEVTEFYETQGDQMAKTMEITYVKM
jgi:hypothetical protein